VIRGDFRSVPQILSTSLFTIRSQRLSPRRISTSGVSAAGIFSRIWFGLAHGQRYGIQARPGPCLSFVTLSEKRLYVGSNFEKNAIGWIQSPCSKARPAESPQKLRARKCLP